MPWQGLWYPAIALGVLDRIATDRGHTTVQHCAYLEWAALLVCEGVGDPNDYQKVLNDGYSIGLGDWVFSGVLYPHQGVLESYVDRMHCEGFDDAPIAWREMATDFCEQVVADILAAEPDVVALTTTYMQTVPSLAIAKRVKELRPDITVVFGGSNCDGPMGQALHRNFDFIDFTVRGEGEEPFGALLDMLAEDRDDFSTIGGMCWRDHGQIVMNEPAPGLLSGSLFGVPILDPYFETIDQYPELYTWIRPELVIETARGCWWGAAHHCTFCGLSDETISFRARPAVEAAALIEMLVARHHVLEIFITDNILSMDYYATVLPAVTALDYDLHIWYELKANVREREARALQQVGALKVQPGVENLSSQPLALMDKGTTGARNIQVLRDLEARGITAAWNYLYGFPGEEDRDYRSVIEQMPQIKHLVPPGGPVPIALERFNPYFERPELGFAEHTPAAYYAEVYELPASELEDLAYFFDTNDAGISPAVIDELGTALTQWNAEHRDSTLMYRQLGETILIQDERVGWPTREIILDGTLEREVFFALQMAVTADGLCAQLDRWPANQVMAVVADLDAAGLLFHDDDLLVALPVAAGVRDDAYRPARA